MQKKKQLSTGKMYMNYLCDASCKQQTLGKKRQKEFPTKSYFDSGTSCLQIFVFQVLLKT